MKYLDRPSIDAAIFETDRLYARRLLSSDVAEMFAIYGSRDNVRFVGDAEPLTVEQCSGWVEVTDRNFLNRGYGMLALIEKSSGNLVGCAGIVHPDQSLQPEIKYALRPDRHGLGFATEAVRGLVEYANSTLKIGNIIATVASANVASQIVLRKAGFSHQRDELNEDGSVTQVWLGVGGTVDSIRGREGSI